MRARLARVDRATRVGVMGWAGIVVAGTALEILSLVAPHTQTFSRYVDSLMEPVAGRVALVLAWDVAGFVLFGPLSGRGVRAHHPR